MSSPSRSASRAAGSRQGSRAQRVGAIGYNRPELRTPPQGWLRRFRGPGRWAKQEVMGPQGHLEPCGWFPDLTGMEQPLRAPQSAAQAKPEQHECSQRRPQFSETYRLYTSARLPPGERQRPLAGKEIRQTEPKYSARPPGLAWSLARLERQRRVGGASHALGLASSA